MKYKEQLIIIVPRVSSYRWVHFPRPFYFVNLTSSCSLIPMNGLFCSLNAIHYLARCIHIWEQTDTDSPPTGVKKHRVATIMTTGNWNFTQQNLKRNVRNACHCQCCYKIYKYCNKLCLSSCPDLVHHAYTTATQHWKINRSFPITLILLTGKLLN